MRQLLLSIVILLAIGNTYAQEEYFATGLEIDVEACELIPEKPMMLTRDYVNLPSSYSLKKYCPKTMSQREFGTCTAWACAYEARTIAEAIKNNWTDSIIINDEAFAPLFVYAQIKDKKDVNCKRGTSPNDALDLMKRIGCAKFKSFDVYCAEYIPKDLFTEAENFKIDNYFRLWSSSLTDYNKKLSLAKKSISENRPIIICMDLYDSFFKAYNQEFWDGQYSGPPRCHAMTVVAYDDTKQAFQIMNSWGEKWGKDGFIWVKYDDFCKTVGWAYELYVSKKSEPEPQQPTRLSGEIFLQLATGETMPTEYVSNDRFLVYKLKNEYISGTRYRAFISNNEPAYVYIIGSDLENNVSKVFPANDRISPALVYKSNHIAIPDETFYIEMDNVKGKDYMCLLYSDSPLNINEIIANIKNKEGTFYDKLNHALAGIDFKKSDVSYQRNNIQFESRAKLIPVVVEIPHK